MVDFDLVVKRAKSTSVLVPDEYDVEILVVQSEVSNQERRLLLEQGKDPLARFVWRDNVEVVDTCPLKRHGVRRDGAVKLPENCQQRHVIQTRNYRSDVSHLCSPCPTACWANWGLIST